MLQTGIGMDQPELINQMQLLRDEYAAGLKQRLQQIGALFQRLEVKHDEEILQELFRQVHSLAGSAASFGFTRISTQSRSLETLLLQSISNKEELNVPRQGQISRAIHNLETLTSEGPDQALTQQLPSGGASSDLICPRACRLYLVAEDEELGNEIHRQLQYFGYSVQLFRDAATARNSMRTDPPDAILMDVILLEESTRPKLGAVTREFREAGVAVIFFSSRGDWQARLAAVRAGGQAYLTSPIDYMLLFNLLDRVTPRSGRDPYRVLIVDDTVELARHYALVLQKGGMQVEMLNLPENILNAIANFKPEFILLDLHMPEVSGLEVANVIRQHQDLLGLPIVFLSTEQDRDLQLRALQNGDDFLQKPISDDHLFAAIVARAERARALNTLMYRDGLTGLLNHSTLKSRLQDEIHRARRIDSKLCYVVLDLDNFRTVNDTYGYPVGDRVIKGLSRILTDRLRKTDQVGRYGGEEFAVILPDTSLSSALRIMDEIRQNFSALAYTANGTDFNCSFSAGIVQTGNSDSAQNLCRRADEMLYRAKRNGRNRIECLE